MRELEPFLQSDLQYIPDLQPSDWGDIRPRFAYFVTSLNCEPLKMMHAGRMVAVGTTIKHANTAWLACIIVHSDFRNRGLGAEMTLALINSLDPKIFKTIYLDATDLGYPVYQKSGFQLECTYTHFLKKDTSVLLEIPAGIQGFHTNYLQDVLQLDAEISGENRSFILQENLVDCKVIYYQNQLTGFYLPQLSEGLIVAKNMAAGIALMQLRALEKPNAAMPSLNQTATELLPGIGFELLRTSRRMYFGEKRNWKPEGIFNRISGQLG
jgi:GNAT superfamily N-acetyltransferase